jgi:hypothetical protein
VRYTDTTSRWPRVSASTQNQAKSAVLFLYKEVVREPRPWLEGVESARRPEPLPVVLTRHLSGTVGFRIGLLYGTGMRSGQHIYVHSSP